MPHTLKTILVIALATVSVTRAAEGANSNSNQMQQNVNRPERPVTADQEFRSERLTAFINLPDVPQYTGKAAFLTGLRYPNDHTGQRVGLTLAVTEEQAAILDWYRQSLKMYGWTVSSTLDPNLLAATKAGNTLSVRVANATTSGYRSNVILAYKYKQ